MSIYPAWFQVLRAVIRPFFHPLRVDGAQNLTPDQPYVLIARHLNNYGPCAAYLFAPTQFHMWTFHTLLDTKKFYKHCSEFTFSKRAGLPLWLARICAALLCWWAPFLFRKVGMIPVYRGLREVLKTMDLSVDALVKGENLFIMPDVQYINESGPMGEMYTGFIHLGKLYYKRTGKQLHFVPLCINRNQHTMRVGRPIAYDPAAPTQQEKERIRIQLTQELDRI